MLPEARASSALTASSTSPREQSTCPLRMAVSDVRASVGEALQERVGHFERFLALREPGSRRATCGRLPEPSRHRGIDAGTWTNTRWPARGCPPGPRADPAGTSRSGQRGRRRSRGSPASLRALPSAARQLSEGGVVAATGTVLLAGAGAAVGGFARDTTGAVGLFWLISRASSELALSPALRRRLWPLRPSTRTTPSSTATSVESGSTLTENRVPTTMTRSWGVIAAKGRLGAGGPPGREVGPSPGRPVAP